jgi:ketosteroid isomerase-like protein
MSEANVEIVRRVWEAWERRHTEAVFALYDPAIVWESHSDPIIGGSPLDGLYHGHEGVRQFFREWRESFDVWDAHAETFIDAGDNVVVGYQTSGRGKASGAELGDHKLLAEGRPDYGKGPLTASRCRQIISGADGP